MPLGRCHPPPLGANRGSVLGACLAGSAGASDALTTNMARFNSDPKRWSADPMVVVDSSHPWTGEPLPLKTSETEEVGRR